MITEVFCYAYQFHCLLNDSWSFSLNLCYVKEFEGSPKIVFQHPIISSVDGLKSSLN